MEETQAAGAVSATVDNDFFKQMLDLIPVRFYFSKTTNKILNEVDSGKGKGQQNSRKRKAGEAADKNKMKHLRLDVSMPQTVTQIQSRMMEAEENRKQKIKKTKGRKRKEKKVKDDDDDDASILSSTDSIGELRAKLQAKIKTMEGKRNMMGKEHYYEKKRIKRNESKLKQRFKRQVNKQMAAKGEQPTHEGSIGKVSTLRKQLYNSDGKMVFSKFDFSESSKGKKQSDLPTGKDYKRLLEKVGKQKEKVAKLRETDAGKAEELVQKTAWRTAMAKAEGIKVKDDTELLKKSLKRKEKGKQRNTKAWEERTQDVEKKNKDKQEKRRKNIQSRKKGVIKRKIDKQKKKGRIIPGFS